MRLQVTTLAALLGLAASGAAMQSPPRAPLDRVQPGESSIRGRVIDRASERPIEGAFVTLTFPTSTTGLITQTDRDGRYAFDHIADGRYRVAASHPEYATSIFAPTQAPNPNAVVVVEHSHARADIDFALVRGGGIAGRVLRHDGEPLKNAAVLALPPYGDGGFTIPTNATVRTNARGEYALSNLPEGHYHVSATWNETGADSTTPIAPRSAQTASPPRPVYYPGTASVHELVPVAVSRGATARNIDIVFPSTELLRISGKVVRSGHESEVELFLMTGRARQPIVLERDGAFTTPLLRAGRYSLIARAAGTGEVDAAMVTVDLSFDIDDLILGLMPAGVIAGRVVTDDGTPVSDEMQVAAVLADDGTELDEYRRDRSEIGPGGEFRIRGVFGQRVIRMVGVTAGWKISRVTVGRVEVTTLTVGPGVTIDDVLIVLTRT